MFLYKCINKSVRVRCIHKLWHTYECGVPLERSYILLSWAECLPLFGLLTSVCDHSALISLLSYSAVETNPYAAIQSPSLCLFWILWRPQALLLLFQLPWIPQARQLIGRNNKLSSFKPLTNLSPNWRSKRLSHADTHTITHSHRCKWTSSDARAHIRRAALTTEWQWSRDQYKHLQHNPLSSSIWLSPWSRRSIWHQFCIRLRSSQPQQSCSRGDPGSSCVASSSA